MKQVSLTVVILLTGMLVNTTFAQIVRNWANAALQVVSPVPDKKPLPAGYAFTADDKIAITVTFNWPVDPATAVVGSSVRLRFPADDNAAASLAWSNDNKTLVITTVKTRPQLLSLTQRDYFSLQLTGTPAPVIQVNGYPPIVRIKAANGHVFDGDFDQKDGGNCVINFMVPVLLKRN